MTSGPSSIRTSNKPGRAMVLSWGIVAHAVKSSGTKDLAFTRGQNLKAGQHKVSLPSVVLDSANGEG